MKVVLNGMDYGYRQYIAKTPMLFPFTGVKSTNFENFVNKGE